MKRFREGDIVQMPLPDGRFATGWILHVSQKTKSAVGFVVFGIEGQKRNEVQYEMATDRPLSMTVLGPLYTSIEAMRHYGWSVIAHQPLSDATRHLTRRRIGGGVYVGDEFVGDAEELGELTLQPMLMMGMPVVYSEIERFFGKASPTF
jgi:hypothetical protein